MSEAGYLGTFDHYGGYPVRPWARYSDPKPQCEVCSVRSICEGCRHDEGCNWCYCDGNGCSSCGTRCRSNIDREVWQADVGSFDLWIELSGRPPLWLPRYIPSVKVRKKLAPHLPRWTYTISIGDLIAADASPNERALRLREHFPEGSQLILNFFDADRYLERVWTFGEEFWSGQWLSAFDAIIAVNYSLYDDDASFEIMHALRRTFMSAQEISDAGHNTIPLLSYVTEKQVYEQVEALGASNEAVNTVAVNFQTVDVGGAAKLEYQRKNLQLLSYVACRTSWRILVYGVSRADLVAELSQMLGDRLVLSNSEAYFKALRSHAGRRAKRFNEVTARELAKATPAPTG